MGFQRGKSVTDWVILIIISVICISGSIYYLLFYTPKNSIELYQAISFADDFEDVQKLMLEGYEDNFKKEDFDYINSLDTSTALVRQFTLFEYDSKTYVIETTPGTPLLKIFAVEELPLDIRNYFIELVD